MDFPRFLPAPLAGAIPFVGAGGQLSQDPNLFYSSSVLTAPAAKVLAAVPTLELTSNATSQQWQLRHGVGFSSGLAFYDATNSKTRMYLTSDGELRVGTATNIAGNTSRLFVFGGSAGANVDIMGDGTIVGGDQAVVELEGSDYATQIKSLYIKYSGVNAIGTTMGITNVNLGQLTFSGASTALIYTTNTTPLIFGINNIEVARLSSYGLHLGSMAGTSDINIYKTSGFSTFGMHSSDTAGGTQLSLGELVFSGTPSGASGTVDGISKSDLGIISGSATGGNVLIRSFPLTAGELIFATNGQEQLRITMAGHVVAAVGFYGPVNFTPYGLATHTTVQLAIQDLSDAIGFDRANFAPQFLLMGA